MTEFDCVRRRARCILRDPPPLRYCHKDSIRNKLTRKLFFSSIACQPVLQKEKLFRLKVNPYSEIESDHGVICILIPKTGGNSICKALFDSRGLGHDKAEQYKNHCQEKFEASFKFSFVRNPLDRLVSAFTYLKKGGFGWNDREFALEYLSDINTFQEFVKKMDQPEFAKAMLSWTHFEPQFSYVCDKSGENILNYTGHYESLERDVRYISQKIGARYKALPTLNKSKRNHYMEYYNPHSEKLIRKLYSKDFDLFGYN